jgi:hypothetical protein
LPDVGATGIRRVSGWALAALIDERAMLILTTETLPRRRAERDLLTTASEGRISA